MNKENCTKGPVNTASIDQDSDHIEVFAGVSDGPQIAVVKGTSHTADKDAYYTGIANAELIASAFNVLHETGMTPRELAERVSVIYAALKRSTDALITVQRAFANGRDGEKVLATLPVYGEITTWEELKYCLVDPIIGNDVEIGEPDEPGSLLDTIAKYQPVTPA